MQFTNPYEICFETVPKSNLEAIFYAGGVCSNKQSNIKLKFVSNVIKLIVNSNKKENCQMHED